MDGRPFEAAKRARDAEPWAEAEMTDKICAAVEQNHGVTIIRS